MAEKTITVIPARKRVGSRKQVTEEKTKLRVAAYCRVSTDRDEQESSYEAQVEHYTEFIDRNPEWQLAGIYADDGISGTNTKKREEFNRMIEDCMASKIDGHYQVHQPIRPQYAGLPKIHPTAEGKEHIRVL